jgi:hypothetical protein
VGATACLALLCRVSPFLSPAAPARSVEAMPCDFEESGRWLVCGGRGWGQGQGQVWEHFSFGVSLPPSTHGLAVSTSI